MKFYRGEMEFEVPESVYYPREDTLLMAKVLENMNLTGKAALEIGCGCGLLSVIMSKKGASVTSVDINPEAVEIAGKNAMANDAPVKAVQSDLFSAAGGTFDLIVFNPPYLPVEEGENDAAYAGGRTGRKTIERFAEQVTPHMKPDGITLILISSLTGEKEVVELFEKRNMSTSAIAKEKVPWEELIVIRVNSK